LLSSIANVVRLSPSKLGASERNTVEEGIYLSLRAVLKLLQKIPSLIHLLGRAFDPKVPFYYGSKSAYAFSPGFPLFRVQAAKKFHELKGFNLVAEQLKRPDFPWPGSEDCLIILNMINTPEVSFLFVFLRFLVLTLILLDARG
jgi:hypothetical protein